MKHTPMPTDVLRYPGGRDVKIRFALVLFRRQLREFLRQQLLRQRRQSQRHGAPAYLGTLLAGGLLCHAYADGSVLPVIAGGSADTVEVAKPSLYTVREAAADLRVAPSTVWAMIASGELESIIIGQKSRRIPRQAIDEYIAARRAQAKTP